MSATQTVLLVHGLWMGRPVMRLLARRTARVGLAPVAFGYATLEETPEHAAARLADEIRTRRARRVVAHSLGGLIALRALELLPGQASGRLVLLGCPLQGCRVARTIAAWPIGARLLGAARETLCHPGPFHTGAWQVGALAGTRRLGLGALAGGWRRPGDGAVALAETHADFLIDHRALPVSHTGMLFSGAVAAMATGFLLAGRFQAT